MYYKGDREGTEVFVSNKDHSKYRELAEAQRCKKELQGFKKKGGGPAKS